MSVDKVYIKEIIVDNYKSLHNSKIEFRNGINIIIGKNGAGKSNILDFIYKYVSRNPLSSPRVFRNLNTNFSVVISFFNLRKQNNLTLLIERIKKNESHLIRDHGFAYAVTINKTAGLTEIFNKKMVFTEVDFRKTLQNEESIGKEFANVFRQLRTRYITYELPDVSLWLTTPNRITIDKEDNVDMDDSYSSFGFFFNLEFGIEVNLLEKISKKTRGNDLLLKGHVKNWLDNYLETTGINEALSKYTTIKEIRFNPNINIYSNDKLTILENLTIDFLIENDWMPWSYLSDGTKRLFYLISEVIVSSSRIILMEEPELGIHPHQLYKILDFLKEESKTKQIIISTHSPLVLDALNEDELNKIIIASNKKGSRFKHLTNTQILKAKKYMKEVGELSYYWLHSDLEL